MAEHDVVDMDVELIDANSAIVDLSMSVWGEEMLASKLDPGAYKIAFTPFLVDDKVDRKNMCESLVLEIAISPVTDTDARVAKLPAFDQTFTPPLSSETIDSYLNHGTVYTYDSTKDDDSQLFNVKIDPDSAVDFGPTYLAHWNFQLTPKPGTNPLFTLEARLGYNFLTSGNLRLLLDNSGDLSRPACEAAEDDEGECKRGTNMIENTYVIQTKLGPGNYTLWLYDLSDRRLTPIPAHPFSLQLTLRQIHGEESFLSCAEQFLPESLNSPGLIDATGFLHFRDEVLLDLSAESQSVTFSVPSAFLLRVWTDQHRVDIDIVLKKKDGVQIARTFKTAGQAESIIAQGEAEVEYELTFKYYGRYDTMFCESFLLELLIQPLTPYYQFDYCQSASQDNKPTVTPLDGLSTSFEIKRTEYHYLWNTTKHHDDIILAVPIRTASDMLFKAKLEAHFLSGLEFFISTEMPEGVSPHRKVTNPRTYRGGMEISYYLESGLNHTFYLRGAAHSGLTDISSFPLCTYFAFEMSINPVSRLTPMQTCKSRRLPQNLAGPSYFGSSNRVHFQDILTVPPMQSPFESSDTTTFTVRQRSLFRAFTESRVLNGQDIDIDFTLKEDGILIDHEVKEEGEEKFTYILKPGKRYDFTTLFFADFSLLPPCMEWNIEWEVAPIFESGAGGHCVTSLPETYPIVVRDLRAEFTTGNVYAFEQTADELIVKIPISIQNSQNVSDVVYFRSVISYDFIWSDLSIRLLDAEGEVVALGQNLFNKNEIVTLQLTSGNYTLEIFEPQALEQEELHHCTEFSFYIGIAPHSSNQIQILIEEEEEPCPFVGIPHSWDSAGGLSVLTDYTLHDSRNFRKHGQSSDSVEFTVTETSFFRAFIPPLDLFDVDIYLHQVNEDGELTVLEKGVAYHQEENIFRRLEPGNYKVTFKYYFFPDDELCLTFPAELGVATEKFISTYLSLNPSLCQTSSPQLAAFVADTKTSAQYFRKTTEPYTQKITFDVDEPSVFKATLAYSFFTGHLFFRLNGYNITSPYLSTPKDKTIYAWVGEDVAFFDHLLFPGNYELIIDDEFSYPQNASIPSFCTRFVLAYELRAGSPDNYCDDADTLPQDLFSPFGGSKYYGGPQKADGSVRISGQNFVLPEYRSHSDVAFRISQPSWFRAWAKFDNDENDVDFLLWENKEKKTLISAAAGITAIESHSAFLQPKAEPYVLDLFVYSRVPEDCKFFHFELAIETNATVGEDLICPDPLPSPALPPAVVLADEPSITIYREMNVFTSEYVASNKKHFWLYDVVDYEMTINVPGPDDYLLFAILGYDFILMDMEMRLLDVNRTLIERSDSEIPPYADTFVDFESFLQTRLTPGRYTLVISEKLYDVEDHPRVPGTCDKFSFLLGLDSLGTGDNTFRIDRIIPPEGSELNAEEGLLIEVTFTKPLGDSVPTEGLLEWASSNKVFYLLDVTDNSTLLPSFVNVQENREDVILTFYPLVTAHTYTLEFTESFLKDEQGHQLQIYTGVHTYSTFTCQCGKHGHCLSTINETICVCDAPYTGPECNACELGFHKAHTDCVANRACAPNTCNGHGKCNDESGSPVCTCDAGYDSKDSSLCGICAAGYIRDNKECVKQDDDRTARCTTPILPTTLNSVAHLGVNGRMHLQGDYYIDLVHTEHNMEFTLTKESYFRVYSEPHEIDIDLWLSRKVGDVSELIEFSIAFNDEETIFRKLEAGTYLLNFQYLVLKEIPGDCHSFNFELAISPVSDFNEDVDLFRSVCKSVDFLPDIELGTLPLERFEWGNEKDVYTVTARNDEDGKPRDFWSRDFVVPRNTGTSTLIFDLHLGYRFLTGDIAVRLERTDVQEPDRDGEIKNKVVAFGYNGYNQHFLYHYVQEGSYKVILYLPAAQNSTVAPCTPFTLSIRSSWKTKEEDIFSCPHAKLPSNFNSLTLADRQDLIRVIDRFLIEDWSHDFNFTTTEACTLRVDATSEIPFSFELQQASGSDWKKIAQTMDGELYIPELAGGYTYRIVFSYEFLDELIFCPSLDLEFVLHRKADVHSSLSNFPCPGGHFTTLPPLPRGLGSSLPYRFSGGSSDHEVIYYAFPELGSVIGEWTLTITEDVYFDLTIGSFFLTSNIRAELESSNHSVKLRSDSESFNNNRLVAELQPDTYTLRLTQAESTGVPLVPCSPYTFSLQLENLGDWRQSTYCEDLSVVPIPKLLNGLRYLGFDGSLKLQSNKWLVPHTVSQKLLVETTTYFQIKERSLFRIYVEEHKIDIDVELYATDENYNITDLNSPLVTGLSGFGEESFVITLDPGRYGLKYLFWNWENEQAHCLTFDMQYAISPLSQLPDRPKKCTDVHNNEHVWPSVPQRIDKSLPLPFTVDSYGHFQQSDSNGFSQHTYEVTVSFDFDIHLELGYNFIVGDLVLQFAGEDESFVEYGSNEYTRNVYNKKAVPAGKYTITVYEATANAAEALGCSEFSFFMFLDVAQKEVVEVERRDSGWLPTTLNLLPYLLYSNELKLHERAFLVFSTGVSSVAKTITFDVKTPSLFHLVIDGGANSAAPFLANLQTSQPKSADLLQVLQPGSYTINLYPNRDTPHLFGGSLTLANIHLSIQPYEDVQSDVSRLCTAPKPKWNPETITVRSTDGYYHYREMNARLDSHQVTVTGDLYSLPLEVERDSIVSIQVYYEFLWGDLHLTLAKKDGTPTHHGNNDFNSNDLQAFVTPGEYQILISQPLGWPSTIDYHLPCSEFFIRISISGASSRADRVDCSAYEIFPWDLMREDGGSKDFGGPMQDGRLHLWSDKFLMNGDGTELESSFLIAQPSLVSLFISQPTWNDLAARVVKGESDTSIAPFAEHQTWYQQAAVFRVDENSPSHYEVDLTYLPSSWTSCAQFSFGLAIAPIRDLEQELAQSCSGNNQLPPEVITQNVFQLSSHFTDKDIAAHTKGDKGFIYDIEFSITETTDLDVALSYNPLYNFFILRLYTNRGGETDAWSLFSEGSWNTVSEEESALSFTQVIDVRLDQRFPKYRLSIEQQNPLLAPKQSSQTFCYPFNFVFQMGSGDQPFVRYVEPTQGEKLNPDRDFYLELRFSSQLYISDTGRNPTAADRTKATRDALVTYLFLQDLDEDTKKVQPTVAQTPEDNPQPDDGTRWMFTFSSKNLEFGSHYQLRLVPHHLFDKSGKEVVLRTVHNYTMAEFEKRCNGHGTFNEVAKKCVCNSVEHRTGPTCTDCEPGYHEQDGKCVRPAGCSDNTCGCGPASTASHCEPLGVCSASTDPAHPDAVTCSCNSPKYDGDRCEKCAPGYSNYPMCTRDLCDPPCEQGTCQDDGKCKCKDNWAGDTCNQCAPGFSGSKCETKNGIMKVVGMILVVFIVCGLVAAAVWYFKFRKVSESGLVTNEDILLEGIGHKPLESGSDSDSSSLGSSDSWPEKKGTDGTTADANSLTISSSDSDEEPATGGNNLL